MTKEFVFLCPERNFTNLLAETAILLTMQPVETTFKNNQHSMKFTFVLVKTALYDNKRIAEDICYENNVFIFYFMKAVLSQAATPITV